MWLFSMTLLDSCADASSSFSTLASVYRCICLHMSPVPTVCAFDVRNSSWWGYSYAGRRHVVRSRAESMAGTRRFFHTVLAPLYLTLFYCIGETVRDLANMWMHVRARVPNSLTNYTVT